ncbi:peptidylprolyl isomerase [Nitrosomonas sp. JL21]|uniref:peptidylprolyl isomerase n=1 Tax=Nitrosomonas sp. JL21 TaxID=153949 RepID=UPI00136F7AF2|nr:peptidylprolyl isomerase [Nitrosomonas sp. JL21]MBL8498540.1 peptidylprolyl isomerase [Nitrosomonas sp.]MCC7091426.1 peptidylprolyl isomerase [Nitrosomonas sp.]MXS77756.1 peptidylprolyl isomerase [Nitrosomonas sp. JL21]
MHSFKNLCRISAVCVTLWTVSFSSAALANRIACFHTNMGNFCMELFEPHAPITTANFLSYITTEAYTHGIFHRSVPSFVIQGGGFKIVDTANGKTLAPVTPFNPINNEFGISNTRGTVAMAKVSGDPNSATSQWFVNLNDENSQNLDNQNGGFTVFGRILFDGMLVFDAIEQLPIVNLGPSLSATPLFNYDNSQVVFSNFVQIDQVEVFDTTGVFSEEVASFAVDIGTSEALEVKLRLIQVQPSLIFELEPSSIVSLPSKPANIATFSRQSEQLLIPSVMINSSTIVKNVTMKLTDPQTYQFTLQHFE